MKLIVFDVGNAACTLIATPSKYGMMIDCGSNSEKINPIDLYSNNKDWLGIQSYYNNGVEYKLGLLHITHPDDDHVRNAVRIKKELTPYLLRRTNFEEFPDSGTINKDYIDSLDKNYRGTPVDFDFEFEKNRIFQIPMSIVTTDEKLKNKVRNNSSILRYLEYGGCRILFGGDLETEGWEWLIKNDPLFVEIVKNGVDIYIASHHGHKSGYSKTLFDLIGNVKVVIHSKGSEGSSNGTDVSSQYTQHTDGVTYKNLNDDQSYKGGVMTTRSNGNIFISINTKGLHIWTGKASPNHEKVTAKV